MSEPSLSDLDRCLHGRHAIDPCFDCPGGWSMGNAYLVDGQRIGTDIAGKPILVGRVKGPINRLLQALEEPTQEQPQLENADG